MGVDDPKPCHALRKEFGSYVATNFSLFPAIRLVTGSINDLHPKSKFLQSRRAGSISSPKSA
jgi:hypothetical protein